MERYESETSPVILQVSLHLPLLETHMVRAEMALNEISQRLLGMLKVPEVMKAVASLINACSILLNQLEMNSLHRHSQCNATYFKGDEQLPCECAVLVVESSITTTKQLNRS